MRRSAILMLVDAEEGVERFCSSLDKGVLDCGWAMSREDWGIRG